MAKHRTHSAAFKRQVAKEFIAGEALHALSKRHDISRQLIRIWVGKFEAGALDAPTSRRPICSRNTKRRSQPSGGRSGDSTRNRAAKRGSQAITPAEKRDYLHRADFNEGGHLLRFDRGQATDLMAASLASSHGPILVIS